MLAELSDREKLILKLKMGFNGKPKTYKQIASKFGVSISRPRQILEVALRKLRRIANYRGINEVHEIIHQLRQT
ncbi:hypothetical protein KAR91_73845 [Candidatus Pacearchaeota archaeon]|nr:hypothetical protein [Candidatus Pacearchaeota archaeon]